MGQMRVRRTGPWVKISCPFSWVQFTDLVFVLDGTKQTLAGSLPNPFFGHVILVFEDLMARYFERKESV